MEFASKGVANTALGLSIGSGVLGLANGGLANLFGGMGGNCGCSENMPVNRYEAAKDARIAELETEVKLRDATTFTLGEVGKLRDEVGKFRDYVEGRYERIECQLSDQKAYNAANNAALGCINGQIAQLYGLTKLIIPNTSIYPGWGNVTVAPEAAAATTP